MTDGIELVGLRLLGHHGALPGEKDRAQPFGLDLFVETDVARAAESDDLAEAIDYGLLVRTAATIVEKESFSLLETLAATVADALVEFDGVRSATVVVRKLRPPVQADLVSAGVRVTRYPPSRPGT